MFAPAWSTRTAEDDPGAPFFNESPKYVVSSTLADPEWSNSSVIGPYDPAAIQELKMRVDGNLYVSGSAQLVRAMLADGLVDELHLFVYPLTLGEGLRLFDAGGPSLSFTLAGSEAYDSGVLHVAYRRGS
jgi:dihydrofolate reductase